MYEYDTITVTFPQILFAIFYKHYLVLIQYKYFYQEVMKTILNNYTSV